MKRSNRHRALQTIVFTLAFAAWLSFTVTSCGPQLKDSFDPAMLSRTASWSCFSSAPIVAVGVITDVASAGRPRVPQKGSRILLEPIRISIIVENVLRGEIQGPKAEIFGFHYSLEGQGNFPGKTFQPRPGQRRLFLLVKESGILRLYVDEVRDFYAPIIASGRHPALDAGVKGNPGKAIAWILLTPGEGLDESGFAVNLAFYTFVSMSVTHDEVYVFSLLENLKKFSDERVRREAAGMQQTIESEIKDGNWTDPTPPCPAHPPPAS